MQYTMLLWPHANARYQAETGKLARAELSRMLDRLKISYEIEEESEEGMPSIRFSTQAPLNERAQGMLAVHSLLYGLFERREDGSLYPLLGRLEPKLGSDLAGILKYKGKTNEIFTQLLLNMAWLSGGMPLNPKVLDPMCGRATTLFVAANRGWEAVGTDIDRADLHEAEKYFKRYLEYHRVKHKQTHGSLTLLNKKSAPFAEFHFFEQSMRLAMLDCTRISEAFGRKKFDLVVADLPYGVQHGAGMPLEKLLEKSFSDWHEVLRIKGAVAVSFNAQTLPTARVRRILQDAGFEVMQGGSYDMLSHWVEQAVTRDIAIGVRV